MAKGFGSTYVSKKCNCDMSNWEKYRTKGRCVSLNYLIHCNKCQAQWYSKAKYVEKLPFGK